MFKKTFASLAFATSLLALPACKDSAPQVIAVHADDVAKPGQLTVTGSATIDVSPDCADITMTVSATSLRPGEATRFAQTKQQQLIAALVKLGIQTGDMKLSHLSLHTHWDGTDGRADGYEASITVVVTTKKFDQIAAIMDAGAHAGATAMTSQFRRSDLPELKKKVRDMALLAAQEKAAQTARTLGIETGRIVSVVEAPAGSMWTSPYFANEAAVQGSRGGHVALGGALQPLTLDVTIGFELVKSA